MQLLMNEQEKIRKDQFVHNKVMELSVVDTKIDTFMDV